jgi:hypothetical protein
MVISQPDPEFWKKLYGDEWESAAQAVKALHEKVVQKYPELEDSVKFGLGATTGKKVRIPPGQKHEADITYYYDYKPLCGIQVSAPQKGRVPPGDIWVLKGKYEQAVAKEAAGEKVWFYFEYPLTKQTYALDVPIIGPFEKNVEIMRLKRFNRTLGTGAIYQSTVPESIWRRCTFRLDW